MNYTFKDIFNNYNWDDVHNAIYNQTSVNVESVLNKTSALTPTDFMTLVSPAAEPYLDKMAQMSHDITLRRFGHSMQMYVPMYLSNECQNICTYCGFSFHNKVERLTLNDEQILKEVQAIKAMGYNHILLVSGEANKTVGTDYFKHVLNLIRPYFSHISMEVQPLDQTDYELLIPHGLNTVLVYQETYHQDNYKLYNTKGKKSNFDYRLETPDRLGKAGIHKIGLGVLLGLEEWRTDCFYVALHLQYLEKKYWQTRYAISFPRLRPATGCQQPKVVVTDKHLLQLICAYRIFNANVELSLSTREKPLFRNNIIKLGITHMSAGSKTNPGGYAAVFNESLEQFEVSDNRNPSEIAAMLKTQGYEPVWKDWDRML